MEIIDKDLNLKDSLNPNVRAKWFTMAFKKGYKDVFPNAKTHIRNTGNYYALKSFYQTMLDSGFKKEAHEWFNEYSSLYHEWPAREIAELMSIPWKS